MWRSVNVQLVPGLVGGHFCLWSLLTVSGSSWIHTCWARWLGWVYHIWALKGSGLFADRPGFLECMVEGAITGWSPCVQRYSFQMDIIENRIEYVFLPYWRSQLASFQRIRVSLALAVEKEQRATKAPHVFCDSLSAPPQYGLPFHRWRQRGLCLLTLRIWKHRAQVFCLLLHPHLSLSMSPEPGLSVLTCHHAAPLQVLFEGTHVDLRKGH